MPLDFISYFFNYLFPKNALHFSIDKYSINICRIVFKGQIQFCSKVPSNLLFIYFFKIPQPLFCFKNLE